ncbi:MAG: winged helix-turn-helix domain-containing protein [Planctomycetaceae bacterium]
MAEAARRRRDALTERRDRVAGLFAGGATQAMVAHGLKVSRVTAMRWHHAWRGKGAGGLAVAERLGRPPRLEVKALDLIDRRLRRGARGHGYGTEVWTLHRVSEVIAKATGVRYHVGHVGRVLRRMVWSLQRPTTRARARDEDAIREWVKVRWPDLDRTSG